MSVLVWIALGLIGGAILGYLLRFRGRALVADAVVGVLGAIIGGFLASALLGLDVSGIDWTSILVAALGTALMVLVLHALPAADVFE